MAIDPRERLKHYIDEMDEEEARRLLDEIETSNPSNASFEDVQDEYGDIKDRFEEAFRELAK